MTTHHVRINMISSGRYAVTGSVQITDTPAPIQDAALALREAGHPDSDTVAATSGDVAILPHQGGKAARGQRDAAGPLPLTTDSWSGTAIVRMFWHT